MNYGCVVDFYLSIFWSQIVYKTIFAEWKSSNDVTIMTIYDYNEGQIAAIIICGSLLFGLFVCMGMCGVLYG